MLFHMLPNSSVDNVKNSSMMDMKSSSQFCLIQARIQPSYLTNFTCCELGLSVLFSSQHTSFSGTILKIIPLCSEK
jgi:hypothetical protein